MKRKLLTFVSLGLTCFISMGVTGVSATAETTASNEPIALYFENEEISINDETITFSAELVPDSTETRDAVIAGFFNTTIYIEDNNRYGEVWWSASLGTGDFIKSVTGTIIVKRDLFGPINPVLDVVDVNYVNYGTLFSTANDVAPYDLGDTYKDSQNFIFQFENFQIQGVQEHYTVGPREVQKEIRELERFPANII